MLFLDSVLDRRLQPEIIDRPGLEPGRLHGALRGLERINWWSRSAHILWPSIKALAKKTGLTSLSLLDVATGAGDIPIKLRHKARRAGLDLQIAGCDRSRDAIEYARRHAEKSGAAVNLFEHDVVASGIPGGYDIVACSLFLHHLQEESALTFLKDMARSARRLVLINDLARSKRGHLLAWAASRILTTSEVVHNDALRSVEGAFTLDEARALAERAGLHDAKVTRKWPFRYLLAWERPSSKPTRVG
jgi:2-polyprenyl-3-methyl-5-hydroxy-6-metoxy-1,4-benzoquinol methylase